MADAPAGPSETKTRSIVKTISWRALATLTTGVIALASMSVYDTSDAGGKAAAVGTIAGFEVPTKLLLYYLHERAWARARWGRVAATGA